jgi:hypothetical protein
MFVHHADSHAQEGVITRKLHYQQSHQALKKTEIYFFKRKGLWNFETNCFNQTIHPLFLHNEQLHGYYTYAWFITTQSIVLSQKGTLWSHGL